MEMQDMLADRLKQKRALSHASLEEYSKELGISKSALQKYEAGTGNPTLATVQTIADHLHPPVSAQLPCGTSPGAAGAAAPGLLRAGDGAG